MFGYGLGKSRSDFGMYLDQNGIKQGEVASWSGVNRDTVAEMSNNPYYDGHKDKKYAVVSALRKQGYDVSISDFW